MVNRGIIYLKCTQTEFSENAEPNNIRGSTMQPLGTYITHELELAASPPTTRPYNNQWLNIAAVWPPDNKQLL